MSAPTAADRAVVDVAGLDVLIAALARRGYEVIGPQVRHGAIVYDELATAGDLPIGWRDEQEGGHYRLVARDDHAHFGYAVGPDSWKRYLLPPSAPVLEAQRTAGALRVTEPEPDARRLAFIGARACELAAIAVQDRIFVVDDGGDPLYASRRADLFIVAVQCTAPATTCFCVSMGTGPRATNGYDLALTELTDGEHRFVVEAATPAGAEVLAALSPRAAADEDLAAASEAVDAAARRMGRHLDTDGLKELLYHNLEHPRWDDVADRCLACGNCTMVCPTCFCTSIADTSDLAGTQAARERVWDSCFSASFAYVHGGSVRSSVRARYRQWMTHKLATWIDQFGTSGCVGCGRCITWCPVGIDLTEEAAAIRAAPGAQAGAQGEMP